MSQPTTQQTRKILHLDLDAFFCAVEEQRDTSLRGVPFAVGGSPEGRGVVASCSYPARKFGVHSAMPMAQAMNRCPGLVVVSTNFRAYRTVSRQVMKLLHGVTPLVEQLSIDEAFLDVTELPEPAVEIAGLQSAIRRELDLPSSLGVATNKLVAKIANNVGKASVKGDGSPNAIQVVPPGHEEAFLAPLPSNELWGVGPKTAERLAALGIETIGDIARWSPDDLIERFGKHGADLSRRARGIDTRPIVTSYEPKSVSQERTFSEDSGDRTHLRQTLRTLADGVSRQLKRKGITGTTVKLKLRWSDFTTPTRQMTIAQPTDDGDRIFAVAIQLFEQIWEPGRPVRLLGVGVSGLGAPPRQMSLWDKPDERGERLQETIRTVRDRFGEESIVRAAQIDAEEDEDAIDSK